MIDPVRAQKVAARMLEPGGLADGEHTRLANNLAQHLQQIPENYVERFEQGGAGAMRDVLNEAFVMAPPEAFRPILKIERDLEKPYTDQQVTSRAQQLDTRLQETLREHMRLNGSYPRQMWVAGSLIHGDFGANSDADVIIDGGPGCKTIASFDHQDVHLQYLHQDDPAEHLAFFKDPVPVDMTRVARGEPVLLPLSLKSIPHETRRITSG